MNFAVALVNAAGSPPSANVSLLAMSHTTTLTSYAFGSGSNEIVPSLRRRNFSFETRSANNVRIKCERSLLKKPDHPTAARSANTSARTDGADKKNTRKRKQTQARPKNPSSSDPIGRAHA